MSVIVKGMKMPNCCLQCQIRGNGSDSLYTWSCPFTGFEYTTEEGYRRQDACPLVDLPEKHAKLIDINILKAVFDKNVTSAHAFDVIFNNAPTIFEED